MNQKQEEIALALLWAVALGLMAYALFIGVWR